MKFGFWKRPGLRASVEAVAPTHLTWQGARGADDEEQMKGRRPYLEVLSDIHEILRPSSYLEIGIRHGTSLSLSRCASVGVDPVPEVTASLPAECAVLSMTSDEFFRSKDSKKPAPYGLIFIDGMHLSEYVLRDFANAERLCSRQSWIVLDDVCPNHPRQAKRVRETQVWTGDVWKLLRALRKWRPDLKITLLDTWPTGLAIVTGLDPRNRVLSDNYDNIAAPFLKDEYPPEEVVSRAGAFEPSTELIMKLRDETNP